MHFFGRGLELAAYEQEAQGLFAKLNLMDRQRLSGAFKRQAFRPKGAPGAPPALNVDESAVFRHLGYLERKSFRHGRDSKSLKELVHDVRAPNVAPSRRCRSTGEMTLQTTLKSFMFSGRASISAWLSLRGRLYYSVGVTGAVQSAERGHWAVKMGQRFVSKFDGRIGRVVPQQLPRALASPCRDSWAFFGVKQLLKKQLGLD
jgi:hypothetical protein